MDNYIKFPPLGDKKLLASGKNLPAIGSHKDMQKYKPPIKVKKGKKVPFKQPRLSKAHPFLAMILIVLVMVVYFWIIGGSKPLQAEQPAQPVLTYDQKISLMKNDGWRAKGFILSKGAIYREEINADVKIQAMASKDIYFRNGLEFRGAPVKEALIKKGELAQAGVSPPPFVLEFRATEDNTRLCLFFK